jgi:nucleoside-diphosphate-sugar epimerase
MAKILVTGGTGFIGTSLVKKLYELGHNLKLLIRESSNISAFNELSNIEYIIGDMQDINSLEKAIDSIDIIYHLAAYVPIWAKKKSIYYDINVNGTETIAKLALKNNIKLNYVSSFTAIGPTPLEPVDEAYENEDFCMEYERSKFLAKKKVKEYIEKGLNATLFYPGIVYGPGDFNIFGQMLLDITRGKFLGCPGKGDSIACFSYIPDLIDGMVSVIGKDDVSGEDFILGGENIAFGDYLNLIAEIAETKKPRHFPMSGAKLYAWMCEVKAKISGKVPYITRSTLSSIKFNRAYSSKKAIEKIGYKITPLREGLTKTIEWYKDFIEKEKLEE